jgi:hypothetical protein
MCEIKKSMYRKRIKKQKLVEKYYCERRNSMWKREVGVGKKMLKNMLIQSTTGSVNSSSMAG